MTDSEVGAAPIDPVPRRLWDLVEARADRTPTANMLIEGQVRLSFDEFRDAAEAVAAGLSARGDLTSGSVVAWQLPTCIEAMVTMAALARLEVVQVPLIPLLRHREVGWICRSTRADLLVVPTRWRRFDHGEMARAIAADQPGLEVLELDAHEAPRTDPTLCLPTGAPSSLPAWNELPVDVEDPVRWIFHSSGTTADPKGCRHTDRSVMASATGLLDELGFSGSDVYPIAYPLAHIGGMTALTTQLVAGSTVALHSSFDPVRSPLRMADEGATVLGSALPFFRAYLDAQRDRGDARLYPRLRACIGGGAPKPPALHREVADELGGIGILGSWGLTECPVATFASPADPDDLLATAEGRPVRGVEVRVDADGELLVRGPQLFAGYVDAAMDRDAFTKDGFFRTGDLGVVHPSGHVQITGRTKDVIIRNAENLSALEIENAVRTHPSVADVAVVGVPDERTGERACAAVVLRAGCEHLELVDLGEHCLRVGLAAHKRPEQLVILDDLPRNALGKVVKRDLIGTLHRAGRGPAGSP